MTRAPLAFSLAFFACASAQADVTLHATSTGQAAVLSGTTETVTYIKGLKMRSEALSGKRSTATIYDVDAQKMIVLDTKKKEATVWDMAAFSQEMSKSIDTGGMQASITPNGQVKTVNGQNADGYDLNIAVPATLGGSAITINLSGVSWIAKGAPGSAEYSAFYKGAGEKGWIFSDPRAAEGQPGQAKAVAQMYIEFAKIGGLPVETSTSVKTSGEGPVAAIMSKMGALTTTTVIDSVATDPLDDSLFQVPADYKLKQR